MRNLLIVCAFLMISCKSNYTVSQYIQQEVETCPENGVCSIELFPNKAIVFKTDNIGIMYPEISEGSKTILKYTYTKNTIKNIQDSSYTEIIYAEFDADITPMELSDETLQNVKLYFGRLCYCKGETGYFPVKNGELKLTKINKNSFKLDLNFSISEVPQIISKISETISLKSN
ncbi:hypothetical protein MHL31_11280 [Lutibacter sp. A80]|uniref:hypothetical protein n=1 Tax=Lutibacter sp. A80 TaxID=2918453 RepID=UPI001F061B2C|nr:hypothetical protein [Lutibacter sp. A80]UMB59657.1 hypothetical protein MHL31_11280 [Lutibacter sp. A80]